VAKLKLAAIATMAGGCSLLTTIPDVTSGIGKPDAAADAKLETNDGAAVDVEAGRAGFCDAQAPRSVFCDDFDDRTDLLARWDSVEPGGVERIDGVEVRSPPHAFLSGPPAQGSCKYSVVRKSWGPSYRASRLGFAVHIDSPHPASSAAVAEQGLAVANTVCQVTFSADPSGPAVEEQILLPSGQVLNSEHPLPTLTSGVWHDITIDYDPDGKIVVTADGSLVLSEPVKETCPQGRGTWTVELGWHCVDNAPADLSVHLDNVTFDPR
jgi:hypothetical protein